MRSFLRSEPVPLRFQLLHNHANVSMQLTDTSRVLGLTSKDAACRYSCIDGSDWGPRRIKHAKGRATHTGNATGI